ncbi:ral GTPase-activating protein subunit beta-like isoform X2 [Anopheles albimanus]|uniref:ral GTPase-activating protein subunit beta-like isoform X2 n=1 Tax=Anopheles albimanus TaxID=7167 RepID=UPI0016402556|nr:ral GTPase-activating protein subunit beta-like isoform X2 [Anopheles albimanus]
MYSEWASLVPIISENINNAQTQSVLGKFSIVGGRDVAAVVIKQLASTLGITTNAEPSNLHSDQEVQWCMDVICHGLSLPLSEHDIIKDGVNIYCEWISAVLPQSKISVPKPILDDPNTYVRKIIKHLYNLFVPRPGEVWPFIYQEELGTDTINRQAVLCHRVLRTLQDTAQNSQILAVETWEALLLFLLAINEILLAPPIVKDDVGDQLCERVLSVLFEVWLLACSRCFPSPSLWKTFQESCAAWRHRIALVEQWNRVNMVLTARLLEFSYGPAFPEMKIADEDAHLVPGGMTNDGIAQAWIRFLKILGPPTDLCCPQVISRTPQFIQAVLVNADGIEPQHHPCLLNLPQIFLKTMKGIAGLVDAFLGITQYRMREGMLIENINQLYFPAANGCVINFRHSGGEIKPNHVRASGGLGGLGLGAALGVVGSGGGPTSLAGNGIASSGSGIGNSGSGGIGAGGGGGGGGGSSSSSGSVLVGSMSSLSGGNGNAFGYSYDGGSSTQVDGNGKSLAHLIGDGSSVNSPTPPLQRRLAKSFSVAPSLSAHAVISMAQAKGLTKNSFSGLTNSRSVANSSNTLTAQSSSLTSTGFSSMLSLCQENKYALAANRPRCNSILHLFGEWLFDAAHIGERAAEAKRRPSSMIMDNRKGSLSQPPSLSEVNDVAPSLTIEKYESGKAEALGALCRIFCAKKTGEEILPVYLARFYMALHQGLKANDSRECVETLASILYNSSDLFRIDLEGIQVLLPSFIAALELILPEKDLKMQSQNVIINKTELRRAAINILLSILALPLHFQALPIRDIMGGPNDRSISFIVLKPRLINILMNALQVETDPHNTHMLLGGLHLCVQDSVTFEACEANPATMNAMHATTEAPNLLSSACSEKSAYSMNSANSSIGGHSTATLSNEPSSLPAFDDFASDIIHELELSSAAIYDSAHALFVRATYLVCHRLISSWKTDLNVSLAALELLSGLAAMHVKDSDVLECKRAVKWICDYICYQCSRPPPAHVKDLHSTIVAAFQCTSAWLMNHPYLLQDKECLTIVLEVVELGISGTKSVGKPGEPVRYKDEKELKPASMRVRDAAENMLTMILEQIDYFPNECGKQSLSSLLDEAVLAKHSNTSGETVGVGELPPELAVKKFKYFVTENSTVLALFEEPLGNDQDPQPTVTVLIRGPFGRHAWTMQLRHLSRSKSGTKYHAPNPGRPVPMNDIMIRQDVEYKHFPDSVERIPPCIADHSIPTLDSAEQKISNQSTKQLARLLEDQLVYEKLSWAETECSVDGLGHAQEASPPNVCHEFQAARLFLSHFGFLNIGQNNGAGQKIDGSSPLLTTLDSSKPEFHQDLKMLDKMSPRSCDTIHVFYVKASQTTESEIIANMDPENVASIDGHFWQMLYTIGWPVTVQEHAGWTGFIGSSWKIPRDTKQQEPLARDGVWDEWQLNGERKVLYWADVSSEMAIVVPNRNNKCDTVAGPADDATDGNCCASVTAATTYERSVSEIQPRSASISTSNQQPRQYSLDNEAARFGSMSKSADPIPPVRRRTGASKPGSPYTAPSAKILLVWLESFEDHLTFPIDDLLHYTRTGGNTVGQQHPSSAGPGMNAGECFVIYLHALASGLLRVKLQGPVGRMNFAIPLIDGMVVSKRVIGSLIRQTASNMAKRKRLDNDSYQPPHVRRRIKIQEIMQKYKRDLTEPEMLADLFKQSL